MAATVGYQVQPTTRLSVAERKARLIQAERIRARATISGVETIKFGSLAKFYVEILV